VQFQLPGDGSCQARGVFFLDIPSRALGEKFRPRDVVMFSLLGIIIEINARLVYDYPCLDEALEGILLRISIPNPQHPSRAFLFIDVLSE